MEEKNNFKITINGKVFYFSDYENKTLLKFLLENEIDIKSNCEGNCACGKCHVKFDQEHYDKMNVSDKEQDVLDRNINLTPTSRLACQVKVNSDLNDAIVEVIN